MSTPKKRRDTGFVYSTQHGELCGTCERPIAACVCPRSDGAPRDGVVRVRRETKGRKGKGVTIVTGIPLAGAELAVLAKELKAKCATGGKLAGDELELQGDHRDRLVALLSARGWTVKRVGG
ncbi:MAG: stress response translation initiation inhibitor YciH [Planctomycetota bacterium]